MRLIINLCFLLFLTTLFLSCDSQSKSFVGNSENVSLLESKIDSLTKRIDSLNVRVMELEDFKTNQILSESSCLSSDNRYGSVEERKIICENCDGVGTEQETCEKCHGNGKYGGYVNEKYRCSYYKCHGIGYYSITCRVCYGEGRVNEYE